jgi:peptidoglycan/LPS O-acetylase OafA/YrhL
LAVEEQFYVSYPLLLILLGRLPGQVVMAANRLATLVSPDRSRSFSFFNET